MSSFYLLHVDAFQNDFLANVDGTDLVRQVPVELDDGQIEVFNTTSMLRYEQRGFAAVVWKATIDRIAGEFTPEVTTEDIKSHFRVAYHSSTLNADHQLEFFQVLYEMALISAVNTTTAGILWTHNFLSFITIVLNLPCNGRLISSVENQEKRTTIATIMKGGPTGHYALDNFDPTIKTNIKASMRLMMDAVKSEPLLLLASSDKVKVKKYDGQGGVEQLTGLVALELIFEGISICFRLDE